jgi:putative ABC transport system ATP-binding protein
VEVSPVIAAVELYRFYHVGDAEVRALRGVSLTLTKGELVAVVGPSGCGKSTLINCLAGLDEPDGGHVVVAGERMTRRPEAWRARLRARQIGILQQSSNLFDHLTVRESIQLQARLAGKREASLALAGQLGLGQRLDANPSELSGGEAIRAGLAVALAHAPTVLLADEPTAEVDSATGDLIIDQLVARSRHDAAVLVVTHSRALAERADRIIELRDGRVVND